MEAESKITKKTYTNRYGDEFVFTPLEGGNILWEGKFEHCRFSMSDENKITMVDPSGGPYLAEGMNIMGKTIKEFKSNENGFLIITE